MLLFLLNHITCFAGTLKYIVLILVITGLIASLQLEQERIEFVKFFP